MVKNKSKRLYSGLIGVSLLLACALRVDAGQIVVGEPYMEFSTSGCRHVHVEKINQYGALMINEWQHQNIRYSHYLCNDCGEIYMTVEEKLGVENHSLSYDDLGHTYGADAHSYRIKCTECSYSQVTSTPCNDNGSTHNKPF